jgi:hypothetical protein
MVTKTMAAAPTVEDVRTRIRAWINGDVERKAELIKILAGHGAKTISDLKTEHYGDVLAKTADAKRHPLRGRKLSQLTNLPLPKWVVEDRIPAGFTVAYSLPKRGKSFYFIELSLCKAAGAKFHGLDLGAAGKVLYLAAEGGAVQVRDRALRIIERRKLDSAALDGNWILVDSPVKLDVRKSVDDWLEQNKDFGPFCLIIVDTLARCMAGDENQTADMNTAIDGCDYIRRIVGCDLILLHHQGWKDQRPRGAIALFAALDGLMRFERDKEMAGLTKVIVEELRDGAPLDRPDYFTLAGGTLDPIEAPATGIDKLAERERAIRDVLVKLCADAPGGVSHEQWRAACENGGHLRGSRKTKDKQWERARQRLIDASCIALDGKTVRPSEPDPADDFRDDD